MTGLQELDLSSTLPPPTGWRCLCICMCVCLKMHFTAAWRLMQYPCSNARADGYVCRCTRAGRCMYLFVYIYVYIFERLFVYSDVYAHLMTSVGLARYPCCCCDHCCHWCILVSSPHLIAHSHPTLRAHRQQIGSGGCESTPACASGADWTARARSQ